MNKELKVALAVIAGALVICVGASVVIFLVARQFISPMSTTDPILAARIGHEIVNYTLPPGYREQNAVSRFGYKMVTIASGSGVTNAMTIVLVESPAPSGMSREELVRQTNQSLEDEIDLTTRSVSTRTVTINGQPVMLRVYESLESGSLTYREVYGVFPGKGNTLMSITAMGAKDARDQAALDSFLASIK